MSLDMTPPSCGSLRKLAGSRPRSIPSASLRPTISPLQCMRRNGTQCFRHNYGPQRSPRRFFQQPEGCMNLFLDLRFAEPTVRFHTDDKVWRLIHFGVPKQEQDRQRVSQSQASLTGKQVQECAAGAVTFRTTQWIMQHLMLRVQAYETFMQSRWLCPLVTKHITAAGMVKDTKQVVMPLASAHWPSHSINPRSSSTGVCSSNFFFRRPSSGVPHTNGSTMGRHWQPHRAASVCL